MLNEREEGKINRVVVIPQIEDARKSGAGEFELIPAALVALRVEQVVDAALNGLVICQAGGHHSEQRPSGLRSGDWAAAARFGLLIAVGRLAPAAAGVLVG